LAKKEIRNLKKSILEFFNCQKWGKKVVKIARFLYLALMCNQNIEGWLNICISYLVYSPIWLNLLEMIATFSTSTYG
jgi:hypothetical protein